MKNMCRFCSLAFSLTAIFLFCSCKSGKESGSTGKAALLPGDTASIFFRDYEHDFGKVIAGEKIAYVFTFENRGKIPLVILSATPSCGCTVSKYSNKPLAPGKSGTLEVIFDTSGRQGRQSKTITVRSNATRQVVLLKITGEVVNNQ